jgi:hypothetical protein
VILGFDACGHVAFPAGQFRDLSAQLARPGGSTLLYALAQGRDAVAVAGSDTLFVLDFPHLQVRRHATGQMFAIHALAFDDAGPQLAFGGVGQEV